MAPTKRVPGLVIEPDGSDEPSQLDGIQLTFPEFETIPTQTGEFNH